MINTPPYFYQIPIPSYHPIFVQRGIDTIQKYGFKTIEDCVEACKAKCEELGVDYSDRNVKLFMIDSDGVWEVTEEGELAG